MNPTGGRISTIVLLVLSACQSVWTYPSFATIPLDAAALNVKTYAARNHTRDSKYIDLRTVGNQHKLETDNSIYKVVGGTLVNKGQFPWMVVVYQLLGGGRANACGGTILSVRWVLTAAHCVANGPKEFEVIVGIVDKSSISYDYEEPGVLMHVTQGAVHPRFEDGINDIALLYMPQDIVFTPDIQPVKLAGRADMQETFVDITGYVFGWGEDGTSNPDDQNYLKYTSLSIISNEECSQYWPAVIDGNICTAISTRDDACEGDSGGPLVVMTNGQPLQVGIVSYGDGGCPSLRPGVYTRVTTYVDWIYRVTGIQY